jgi:pyruvate/2-oxoglutarate/acetoin dehydrogenase E1 component
MTGEHEPTTSYREALRAGLVEALERDERVIIIGEQLAEQGGCYRVSRGLVERFGPARVRDTPLSENTFVGAGIGAALGGLRPIVELVSINFALLALDQIVNHAASLLAMSGGQCNVPLVIRMATGAGRQLPAQHSHGLEAWFAHVPGIKLLSPATLADARGMLWPALQDPNPVLICEHASLYDMAGPLPAEPGPVDISRAMVRRPGDQLTLLTYGASLFKSLEAAAEIGGTAVEVIDLRTLRPLDDATIFSSVRKTHRALIVDEGWRTGGIAAELMARIMENCYYDLDEPIVRLCAAEVAIPYARHLEHAALPQVETIASAARQLLGY